MIKKELIWILKKMEKRWIIATDLILYIESHNLEEKDLYNIVILLKNTIKESKTNIMLKNYKTHINKIQKQQKIEAEEHEIINNLDNILKQI